MITRLIGAIWVVICLGVLVGCAQDMRNNTQLKPYEASPFFPDDMSARPILPNTVARGQLRTDEHFYTGKIGGAAATAQPGGQQGGVAGGQAGAQATAAGTEATAPAEGTPVAEATAQAVAGQGRPQLVDTFPFPVTEATLERGRAKYDAFCSPCHALTGAGDGMIVARGFRRPPSFHDQRLREAPVGHFFDVITNGFGVMYPYGARIAPADRWAIIAYIRALQLSQNATIDDVPPAERQRLQSAGQGAGQ